MSSAEQNFSYKFKLRPTIEQQQLFLQFAGSRRFIYNNLLAWSNTLYKKYGLHVVNRQAMGKRITYLRQQHEFLQFPHRSILDNATDDLINAYKNFFDKRSNYPKFKSKRDNKQSFRYKCDQRYSDIRVEGNKVRLPKIGWVRFKKSQEVNGAIKEATIKRAPSGWYVVLSCKGRVKKINKAPNDSIGIDFGFTRYATFSNGDFVENPRHYRRAEAKLKRLQKKLSRAKKGSANRAKLRDKVARHHERVTNMRLDFQHKLTTKLISENQVIGVENLSLKGMARTNLAKSVFDAGIGETVRQLEYKAEWYGRDFHKSSMWFPSSQLCHTCGHRQKMPMGVQIYNCGGCGAKHNRDHNAAINLERDAVGYTESLNAW